jgi:hypothetical protein
MTPTHIAVGCRNSLTPTSLPPGREETESCQITHGDLELKSARQSAALEQGVKQRIVERTWGRIKMLEVEVLGNSLVIRGKAPSYHVKQLALQGALDVLGASGAMRIELNVNVLDRWFTLDNSSSTKGTES